MVPIDRPKNSASYMSASNKSTRLLRSQSKRYFYGNILNVGRCNISVKQNLKILEPAALEGLQGAKSVK